MDAGDPTQDAIDQRLSSVWSKFPARPEMPTARWLALFVFLALALAASFSAGVYYSAAVKDRRSFDWITFGCMAVLTIDLSNPAPLPARIEVRDELIDDARHQCLERLVPSVLLRIAEAFPVDGPSHIAHTVRPQDEQWPVAIDFHKNAFDSLHAMDKFRPSRGSQVLENAVSLFLRKSIELLECRLAPCRERQFGGAAILF